MPCSFSSKRVTFYSFELLKGFKDLRGKKLAFALDITFTNTNTGARQKAIKDFYRIITINSAPSKPAVTANSTVVTENGILVPSTG